MINHVLVIYNPVARSQTDSEKWLGKLVEELNKHGEYLVSFYPTTAETQPSDLVPLFKPPISLVVAAGGDGTVRFALAALAKAQVKIPCAILPLGTGNVLARNLGVVGEDLFADPMERAIEYILHGEPMNLDLGMMNGEYFAGMAGVGPLSDAFLKPKRHEKTRFKILAYVQSMIASIASSPRVFQITTSGETFRVQASGVFVGVVEDLGVGKKPNMAALNDGFLNLIIMNPMNFKDYAHLGFRYVGGDVAAEEPDYHLEVKEVVVRVAPRHGVRSGLQKLAQGIKAFFTGSPTLPAPRDQEAVCMIDGEEFGTTPMRVTILPNAVTVLAIKDRADPAMESNLTRADILSFPGASVESPSGTWTQSSEGQSRV